VSDDWTVVGVRSLYTAKNAQRIDNRYCGVFRFSGNKHV
jgi:hypothetical protein